MEELIEQVGPFVGILLVLFIFSIGISLIRKYNNSKKKAKASGNWPSVAGLVTLSQVERSVSSDEDGASYSYAPHIEYTYNVNGKNYLSKQVTFGGLSTTGTSQKSQLTIAKFPVNAPVRVFYNPNNPHEAVLETAAGSGAKGALFGGFLLVIVALAMAVVLLMELMG